MTVAAAKPKPLQGVDPRWWEAFSGRVEGLAARARRASRDPAEESQRLQRLALIAEHGTELADIIELARRPLVLDVAAAKARTASVKHSFQQLTPPTTVDKIRKAAADLSLRARDDYGQTAWNPTTKTVLWVGSEVTTALDFEVASDAFLGIDGVARFASAVATPPDGWCDADVVYGGADPFAESCKELTAGGGVRLPASEARAVRAARTRRSFPRYRGGRGFVARVRSDGTFGVSDRHGAPIPDLALTAGGGVIEYVAKSLPAFSRANRPPAGELSPAAVIAFGDTVLRTVRDLVRR